jgi:hypothetical protein
MNPAERDASVAPDSIAALSCSVVTDKSWLFAGMIPRSAGHDPASRGAGLRCNFKSARIRSPLHERGDQDSNRQ